MPAPIEVDGPHYPRQPRWMRWAAALVAGLLIASPFIAGALARFLAG